MTLIIVSLLAILGATFASLVTFEMRNATWQRQRVQGFYIAEAGIAMGYSVLKDSINGLDNLDSILVGADGIPNTDDDGILNFGPSVPFGEGSYGVVVTDNDDGDGDYFSDSDDIVEIVSTGTIVKIKRTINVIHAALPFALNHAIITGGDLEISGSSNLIVQGDNGSVYTNGNITISGSPNVTQGVTASGNITPNPPPSTVEPAVSDAPFIRIPPVDPVFYRANVDVDYELRGNGDVFDVSNQQTLTNPGSFNGWVWNGIKWTLSDSTEGNGTYYIESDAEITGNSGDRIMTIIATGSIEVHGGPRMQPDTTDLLFVAGGDVYIEGNPSLPYTGAILAHEQIKIAGNTLINGSVLAENEVDISGMVTKAENGISGSATITYDGSLSPLFQKVYTGDLNLLSWY